MTTNIIEAIQKNLEYPPLRKVDPNIQETKDNYAQSSVQKLAQAAIPAALAGLYRLSRTKEGADKIIQTDTKTDWLNELFGGSEEEAVQKVARYAGVGEEEAKTSMELIAEESIRVLKKDAGPNPEKIKRYMNDQRHNILVYLPAAMAIGDLLKDEGLDDRTNKMEGPVSSFIHKIENILSGGVDDKALLEKKSRY